MRQKLFEEWMAKSSQIWWVYKFIDSSSSEAINRIHIRKTHAGIPQSKLKTKDKFPKGSIRKTIHNV